MDENTETLNPHAVANSAWINTRFTILLDPGYVFDRAGNRYINRAADLGGFDCNAWRTGLPEARGVILIGLGSHSEASCNLALSVACAAPVE